MVTCLRLKAGELVVCTRAQYLSFANYNLVQIESKYMSLQVIDRGQIRPVLEQSESVFPEYAGNPFHLKNWLFRFKKIIVMASPKHPTASSPSFSSGFGLFLSVGTHF